MKRCVDFESSRKCVPSAIWQVLIFFPLVTGSLTRIPRNCIVNKTVSAPMHITVLLHFITKRYTGTIHTENRGVLFRLFVFAMPAPCVFCAQRSCLKPWIQTSLAGMVPTKVSFLPVPIFLHIFVTPVNLAFMHIAKPPQTCIRSTALSRSFIIVPANVIPTVNPIFQRIAFAPFDPTAVFLAFQVFKAVLALVSFAEPLNFFGLFTAFPSTFVLFTKPLCLFHLASARLSSCAKLAPKTSRCHLFSFFWCEKLSRRKKPMEAKQRACGWPRALWPKGRFGHNCCRPIKFCSQTPKEGERFCERHLCQRCSGPIVARDKLLCNEHACSSPDCVNDTTCSTHACVIEGCEANRVKGRTMCKNHACSVCGKDGGVNGLCSDHQCSFSCRVFEGVGGFGKLCFDLPGRCTNRVKAALMFLCEDHSCRSFSCASEPLEGRNLCLTHAKCDSCLTALTGSDDKIYCETCACVEGCSFSKVLCKEHWCRYLVEKGKRCGARKEKEECYCSVHTV